MTVFQRGKWRVFLSEIGKTKKFLAQTRESPSMGTMIEKERYRGRKREREREIEREHALMAGAG